MRITNTGMVATQQYQAQRNLQKMSKLNEQLNTGKEVNRASDDPYEARRIMSLKNEIGYTEKYNKNIDEVTGWLENTDSTLDKTSTILDTLKKDIIAVGNGSYSDHEMDALQMEMDEKIKQLGDVLNNAYGDKYLMGGTELEIPPVVIENGPPAQLALNVQPTYPNGIDPKDLNGKLNVEISENIDIDYNLSVNDVFTGENGENFLDTINNISKTMHAISTGKEPQLDPVTGNPVIDPTTGNQIMIDVDIDAKKEELIFGENSLKDELDGMFKHVVNKRTEVGTNLQKLTKVKDLNENNITEMTKVLSVKQDTDYSEKIVDFLNAEMIYQASLKVSSKLIQPTLMDFLR